MKIPGGRARAGSKCPQQNMAEKWGWGGGERKLRSAFKARNPKASYKQGESEAIHVSNLKRSPQ